MVGRKRQTSWHRGQPYRSQSTAGCPQVQEIAISIFLNAVAKKGYEDDVAGIGIPYSNVYPSPHGHRHILDPSVASWHKIARYH